MEFIFSMSEYEKAVIYESTPKMNGIGCMVKNLTLYYLHEYGGVWWGAQIFPMVVPMICWKNMSSYWK